MSVESAMICKRVEEGFTPVAGSVVTHCTKCDCELWVAGDMLFRYPEAYHVCLPCEAPAIRAAIEDGSIELPQGAVAREILERFKRGELDDMA